jgi:asparagine synthetase B (glutamine-hydrolysing)
MCGISCYLKFRSNTDPTPLNIDASLDTIRHRGPDERGVFTSPDGKCGKFQHESKKWIVS